MKNISKYNYLFIGVGCFILIGLMSLTYSKFSYEKELSGSINTIEVESEMTLYDTLLAMDYTLDTNVDFSQGASSSNGQGLMMVSSTQNDEYPIVYYRGDVNNNNVIFADFCWLIVRTTETGGTKLIYNGEVNKDGSCTNYSGVGGEEAGQYSDAYIQRSSFNTSSVSPIYVGYMYNDTNTYLQELMGGIIMVDSDGYKTHLTDNSIDSETGRHTQNVKDSTIKGVIDAWYALNIDGKAEENLLEDTAWCADRSVTSVNFPIEGYENMEEFVYSASTRVGYEQVLADMYYMDLEVIPEISPSLVCNRDMDKFTVDRANGNGDLTHPVGLLTMDEIWMAGNTLYVDDGNIVTTYLTIPTSVYWALSPVGFSMSYANAFTVGFGELNSAIRVGTPDTGVRASVSLGLGATISGGNGTFEKPYIVG